MALRIIVAVFIDFRFSPAYYSGRIVLASILSAILKVFYHEN